MSTKVPKPVALAQRYWRRYVQMLYWIFVVVWRMRTHRFHPFMSAPSWFVRLNAMKLHRPGDDLIESVRHEAVQEWKIRVARRNRS